MIRLPASLERRLEELFPNVRDREAFVAGLVEHGLEDAKPGEQELPATVGGTLHLFSDGGSRGNPGQAAIAAILEDPSNGTVVKQHYERIGVETNNVAEYRALIAGLRMAQPFSPNRLICHLDSELVVKQLNGEYRVKMPAMQALADEVQELARDFADVVYTHIPREDNYRADALVNKALDELPGPALRKPPHFPQNPLPFA